MRLEIIGYLLTGAAAAAVIKLIDNLLQWMLQRKAAKEDRAENKAEKEKKTEKDYLERLDKKIDGLTVGERIILLDRIQYLGQEYIKDGSVDFDDRRRLNEMHSVYHNTLGGNGDLDVLMREVNCLPIRASEKPKTD